MNEPINLEGLDFNTATSLDPQSKPIDFTGTELGEQQPEELGVVADTALLAGSYGIAGLGLSAAGGPTGILATSAVAAPIYMAAKYALTGRPPQPLFIPGTTGWSGTALATVEEIALNALMTPMFKGSARVIKGLAKGVDKVSRTALGPIASKYAPTADWVLEKMAVPLKKEMPLAGKSLQEMLQPAIERIEQKFPKAASLIRDVGVQRSLVSEAGKELGTQLLKEQPYTVFEVTKGLKQPNMLSGVKDARAKEILSNFNARIASLNLDKKYEGAFRVQLRKLNFVNAEEIPADVLHEFILNENQKGSVGRVHKALRGIIHNPLATPETKSLAMDLWNMPPRTPYEVAKAGRKASMAVMLDDLKAMPGVFSTVMKKGYMPAKFEGFEGLFVHRDVGLEFEAITKIPKIAEGVFNKFFMSPWKTNKVIVRPATHLRNMVSNIILNDWGGLPFYRADVYMDAVRGMKGNTTEWREFSRMVGGQATSFTTADIAQLSSGTEFGSSVFDKMLSVYDKIVAPARSLYAAEESMFKFAKYLHNLEKGMAKKEAAWDAVKWTFNFNEITPEIAQIGKYAIPFVRWYSKAIPLGIETAVKHPLRMGKWFGFAFALQSYAMQNLNLSNEEWAGLQENLPEYMQKGLYLLMPYRDEKQRLNMLDLTYTIPFVGDVSELYKRSPQEVFLQNPVFTMASTLISRKKFSGMPLYYDWEPNHTKLAKSFSYAWEQLGPAMLPGGTDWKKLWDAFMEKEGSMSVEEAIANAAGIKLAPIDPQANLIRKTAVRKIYDAEIRSSLKRGLKQAKTEQEREEVIKQHSRYRMDIRGMEAE